MSLLLNYWAKEVISYDFLAFLNCIDPKSSFLAVIL